MLHDTQCHHIMFVQGFFWIYIIQSSTKSSQIGVHRMEIGQEFSKIQCVCFYNRWITISKPIKYYAALIIFLYVRCYKLEVIKWLVPPGLQVPTL